MQRRNHGCSVLSVLVLATHVILLCALAAAAEIESEGFEAEETTWQVAAADTQYRLDVHRRTTDVFHTGGGSEHLSITAGNGSFVYIKHAAGNCRVVDELRLTLWVKADRPGLQLLARVVLPYSKDPQTGKPLSTLVRGSMSKQANQWQQLEVASVPQLLDRQIRVLRAQYGSQVDGREAYVDLIVLNVYGGAGQTNVWIDDLEINSPVRGGSEISSAPTTSAATEAPGSKPAKTVRLSGQILNVDDRPMLPRVIEHQGEPLVHLAELGFNAVRIAAPASRELLAEAEQNGLWLIGPPPALQSWEGQQGHTEIQPVPAIYDSVLAWSLGQSLAAPELDRVSAAARQLRSADHRRARPIIAGPETELNFYSRHVDLLSAYRFPLVTSLQLTDYGTWLRERPQLAKPGTPFWTVIQTQPAASLREQWSALGKAPGAVALDPDAIRLLVFTAIGAEIRGLEFASHSRLDAADDATRIRAATLALINTELDLVEPWAAAGTYVGAADSNDATVKGVVLQYDRSRLLIVTRNAAHAQYVPQHGGSSVSFIIPGVPESHDLVELTAGGLRPLKHKRVTGGTLITLDDFDTLSLVLMTPDPLVVNVLSRRLESVARRSAELQQELVERRMNQLEATLRRLPSKGRDDALATSLLSAAKRSIEEANGALAKGDRRTAYLAARRAVAPIGQMERKLWERAAESLRSTVASPFVASLSTLPEHWQLVDRLHASSLVENRLACGDFENLAQMVQAGWQQFEHPQAGLATKVEVVPGGMTPGRSCLRMEVGAKDPAAGGVLVETPPLWVTSPPVAVQAGEVVCIRGAVRVATPIKGSVDGVMVIDSFGGEALAERFGETKGWEQVVLYRAAPRNGELTVTFALTGFGEVELDDVTIRPMRPQSASPVQPPAPALSPTPPVEQARRTQPIFPGPPR